MLALLALGPKFDHLNLQNLACVYSLGAGATKTGRSLGLTGSWPMSE